MSQSNKYVLLYHTFVDYGFLNSNKKLNINIFITDCLIDVHYTVYINK